MHPVYGADQDDGDGLDLGPQILSYVECRKQTTLREWQERRAEYERGCRGAHAAVIVPGQAAAGH